MILVLILASASLTVGLCCHYACGIPHIYEYFPGRYCIRSYSKFLDLETYSWTPSKAKIAIWKTADSKLFFSRCLGGNLGKLRSISNEL